MERHFRRPHARSGHEAMAQGRHRAQDMSDGRPRCALNVITHHATRRWRAYYDDEAIAGALFANRFCDKCLAKLSDAARTAGDDTFDDARQLPASMT